MIEHWASKYVGIPFKEKGRDFGGCDCGGLVLLALKEERGIIAADFEDYAMEDFKNRQAGYRKISGGIQGLLDKEWPVVERPQPFDLLRFRFGRVPVHVGVYIGGNRFLHVEEGALFAETKSLTDLSWGPRFIEFRRHIQMYGGVNDL